MTSDFNFEKTYRFYGEKLACLQNLVKIALQEVIELDTLNQKQKKAPQFQNHGHPHFQLKQMKNQKLLFKELRSK